MIGMAKGLQRISKPLIFLETLSPSLQPEISPHHHKSHKKKTQTTSSTNQPEPILNLLVLKNEYITPTGDTTSVNRERILITDVERDRERTQIMSCRYCRFIYHLRWTEEEQNVALLNLLRHGSIHQLPW